MKHVLTLLAVLMMSVMSAQAQTAADLNEGLRVTKSATTGVFTLSWWGQAGRSYFIQQSFDLMSWQYVPVVMSGAAVVTGMNFSCSDSRQFWRLRYTDDSTYGLSAADADFDYDGLSNQAELSLGLDPFNVDTDGDELNDGWEVANNLDAKSAAGVNGAQGDPDSDGLVNMDEWYYGADPHDADSDNDTLSDYEEVYVYFTYPNLADSDSDGLSDAAEVLIYFTAPLNWDTDGDSLSDGAEVNTHLSNPLSKDSDNDGLNDDAEINTHQTNPNAADSDNDGITDKSEIKQGTNANNASSRPAFESVEVVGNGTAGVRKTKQLTITLPEGERSYMVVIAATSDEYPQYTGYQSEFDDLVDWKITPAGGTVIQGEKHVNELHGEWQQSATNGTSYLGLNPVAIVKIETIQGKASGTTSVQIELGAKNVSDALLPSTLAAVVLPVEIVNKDKAAVSELKVGKMADSGVLSNTGTLTIDSDSDRFFIRIPGAASLGTSTVKLETVENPDTTNYNDNATEIELTPQGGDLISKSLLLVSDDVDDNFPVDGIADDAKNDRTHKIQLDGKVKISAIKIGTTAEQVMDMKVPVKVKKTVKVKLVNCVHGLFINDPCWSAGEVATAKKAMKERYAQAGIKLEITDVAGPDIGVSGWVDNYPQLIGGTINIPQEAKNIFAAVPASSADEAVIYLVRRLGASGSGSSGASTPLKYLSASDKASGYGNKALVSSVAAGYAQIFTAAHELLHILLDAEHADYPTEHADAQMLWHAPTTPNTSIDATKRIPSNQMQKVLLSPLAK